jgi:hypothetical protein
MLRRSRSIVMNCADITTLLRNAENEEADDTPNFTDNAACEANEIANPSPLHGISSRLPCQLKFKYKYFSALGFRGFR